MSDRRPVDGGKAPATAEPQVFFQARRVEESTPPIVAVFSCPISRLKEYLFLDRDSLVRHVRSHHPDVAASLPDGTRWKNYLHEAAKRATRCNDNARGFAYSPFQLDASMKYPHVAMPYGQPPSMAFPPLAPPTHMGSGFVDHMSVDNHSEIHAQSLYPDMLAKKPESHGNFTDPSINPLPAAAALDIDPANRKRQLDAEEAQRQERDMKTRKMSRQQAGPATERKSPPAPARTLRPPSDAGEERQEPVDRESNRAQAPNSMRGQKRNSSADGATAAADDDLAMSYSTDNTMEDEDTAAAEEYNGSSVEVLLQPQTKDITLKQLEVEVANIRRAVEQHEALCKDEYKTRSAEAKAPRERRRRLQQKEYQQYIGRHKAYMQEIHDYCLATRHPVASAELRAQPRNENIPARMWSFGIAAPLEVLRMLLPDSREHAMAFILICFNMMALFYETVPDFDSTWPECLGDLARYGLGLADGAEERDTFSSIASYWFRCALDLGPHIGRLRHHLAVLLPSFSVEQISLYGHALTAYTPFFAARRSLLASLRPLLNAEHRVPSEVHPFVLNFLRAHAAIYAGGPGSLAMFEAAIARIRSGMFAEYIQAAGRERDGLKRSGCHLAIANSAALLEYGAATATNQDRSVLRYYLKRHTEKAQDSAILFSSGGAGRGQHRSATSQISASTSASLVPGGDDNLSRIVIFHAGRLTFSMLSIALSRPKDENLHPMIHISFIMIWAFMRAPEAAGETEAMIPWQDIATFLNVWANAHSMTQAICSPHFPHPHPVYGQPSHGNTLPEDFMIRGLWFTHEYYPEKWVEQANMDQQERLVEKEAYVSPRIDRILWLGHGIASHAKWLIYDRHTRSFAAGAQFSSPRQASKVSAELLRRDFEPLYPPEPQAQAATAAANSGPNAKLLQIVRKWNEFRQQCDTFLKNPPSRADLLVRQQQQFGNRIVQEFLAELDTLRDEDCQVYNIGEGGSAVSAVAAAIPANQKVSLRQEMDAMKDRISKLGVGKKPSRTFEIHSDHG